MVATGRYRPAVSNGYAKPQYPLAKAFSNGNCVKQDHVSDLHGYTKAAKQGPIRLGNLYEKGADVAVNFKAAATLYHSASEKGHSAAQYALWLLHYGGKGVKRDNVQAYIWTNLGAPKDRDSKRRNDPVHLARDFMAQQMTPKQMKRAKTLDYSSPPPPSSLILQIQQ